MRTAPKVAVVAEEKPKGALALKDIFRLSKQVGHVPFREVVKESSGFEVVPMTEDAEDKELMRQLQYALSSFMTLAEKSNMRFAGNRINDVGKNFENVLTNQIERTSIEIKPLRSSGYPDYRLKQGDRITYLDIKATGDPDSEESTFRTFYYSSGRKLDRDGRHLLVKFQMKEEQPKSWKVAAWEIKDLYNLEVGLKTEFNTGFAGIAKVKTLDSSSTPHPKNKRQEQQKLG
jgi:hypothetical protein